MKAFLTLALVLFTHNLFAQNRYIVGPQKVTFRSTPDNTGKIIKMVEVTTKMKLVEELENGWSKVTDKDGTEGYVVSRFLTADVPYIFLYESLKKKNEKLQEKFDSIKADHTKILSELQTANTDLGNTKSALAVSRKEYEELKAGSTQYVQLKEKYDNLQKEIASTENEVEQLESQVSTIYIFWFVAGAGVLVLGWLIGLTTRKRKGYSSQIIID